MEILARFGIQETFYFPLIDRGTLDLAVSADYTPAAADCRISKDGGSWAQATNTIADETEGWSITLTATEMQATRIHVNIIDAATKAVEDQSLVIHTGFSGQIQANKGILILQVDNATFSPTTTVCEFFLISPHTTEETVADKLNGRLLMATEGTGHPEMTDITDYVLANSKMKLTYTALKEAPVDGELWVVV